MDDEFALCWNNFQDNIAAGFQNLYDRGDLVDVTLACDGKLLQAHKIVLAICSPYFQEMFITNPCKHPIIVLKDVGYSVMSELLQFMYQGVVNVKHTELSSFMKIAQTLQIKGLTTSTSSQKSPSQTQNSSTNSNKGANNNNNSTSSNNNNNNNHSSSNNENQSLAGGSGGNIIETRIHSSLFQNSNNKLSADNQSSSSAGATAASSSASGGLKRLNEFNNSDSLSIYSKRPYKRNSEHDDNDTMNTDSMDHMSSDEVFLPPIPQISMIEPKFDLNSVKRELGEPPSSPGSARSSIPPPPFNFDYNYPKQSIEYPNELNMSNDYSKGAGNHMDIPPGGTITMLSSTSLLHGNCIFNRNNTVATQQGMKTYWLCKSYRITMCRARCITHQGRVISATGVHNHQPHMKGHSSNDLMGQMGHNPNIVGMNSSNNSMGPNPPNCLSNAPNSIRMPPQNTQQQHQQHPPHLHPAQQMPPMTVGHPIHHPHHQNSMQQANNAAVIQNMMQNVLSQNNLMHLSNMAPMLNTLPQQQQHTAQLSNIQAPSSLQITPIMNSDSPTSRTTNPQQSNHHLDSPGLHSSSMNSPSPNHNINNHHHNNHHSNNMENSNNPIVSSSSIISVTTSPIDECPSVSQDSNNSSQSNMISSITISPTQPSFKMESL